MMPWRSFMVPAMWAGLLALDITGFGPWMISQPMVCGPLFGWLIGHVRVGIIVGGIVQLLWMDVTPVGVGIPYDETAATILAIFWATQSSDPSYPHIISALMLAIPCGYLFRAMDFYSRRINTLLVKRLESVSDAYLMDALTIGMMAGLVWNWLRYALFYVGGMILGTKILTFAHGFGRWNVLEQGLWNAPALLPVAGMGVVLELFLSDEPEKRFHPMRRLRKAK